MNSELDEQTMNYIMTEVEAMAKLEHPNILRQLEYGTTTYNKPSGSKQVCYIVLELAEIGDMFDVINNSGTFSEPLARYYFKRFLEGLNHCHS